MTPPVIRSAWVPRSVDETFTILTDEIGAWWPLDSHGVFGPRTAGVSFESGRVVERSQAGEEAVWAEVAVWDPPHRLVLAWHPGQGPEEATEVEISFAAERGGTHVAVEHRGWERLGSDRRLGYVGPDAWGSILDRFCRRAET